MTFPLINNLYEYDNKKVIVWGSDIFRTIYVRCVEDNYEYFSVNWFKFLFKAKYIKKIEKLNSVY